jgi:phage tail-like protein
MENLVYLFCILVITVILVLGGLFMTASRRDPLRNCRFLVEIDGIQQTGMCEVSGLEAAIEAVEYREGTDPTHVRYSSGLAKYGRLTLKWGITNSLEIYNWFKNCIDGNVDARNMAVIALDSQGNEKARWILTEAWPVKYQAPDFNAKGNEVAMETVEIVYEGMTRVS